MTKVLMRKAEQQKIKQIKKGLARTSLSQIFY